MDQEPPATEPSKLEPEDYYFEGGLMVFTAAYLLKRGSCCESGCRHCPYGNGPAQENAPDPPGPVPE